MENIETALELFNKGYSCAQSVLVAFAGEVEIDRSVAFRIGAGAVLFLSAITLINGKFKAPKNESGDIAVVPLSIPVTIGPGTMGTLLVLGAESSTITTKIIDCVSILSAVAAVGTMLYFSSTVDRLLGKRNIVIISKLTGLILSALAAQLIFTGIVNFFKLEV